MSSLHWYKQHKIWHKTNKNRTWQTCKCQPRSVQSIGNLVWGVDCKTPAFKSVLHLRVFLWFSIFMFQYTHCLCTPRELLVPVRGARFPKSCRGIHKLLLATLCVQVLQISSTGSALKVSAMAGAAHRHCFFSCPPECLIQSFLGLKFPS